jgi:hypothetical protein
MGKAKGTAPNATERRMLEANDVFWDLVSKKPKEAAKMSYEFAAVAEKYKGGKAK